MHTEEEAAAAGLVDSDDSDSESDSSGDDEDRFMEFGSDSGNEADVILGA